MTGHVSEAVLLDGNHLSIVRDLVAEAIADRSRMVTWSQSPERHARLDTELQELRDLQRPLARVP